MTITTAIPVGRNHPDIIAYEASGTLERCQSLGVDTIIITEQDSHWSSHDHIAKICRSPRFGQLCGKGAKCTFISYLSILYNDDCEDHKCQAAGRKIVTA